MRFAQSIFQLGSGLGIVNPLNLSFIIEQATVPVIVDAGIGSPADAAFAMELGADGVLLNTAVSGAKKILLNGTSNEIKY